MHFINKSFQNLYIAGNKAILFKNCFLKIKVRKAKLTACFHWIWLMSNLLLFTLNFYKNVFVWNAWAYRVDTSHQGRLMYSFEPQTTPWTVKIPSCGASTFPAFNTRNLPACRSSLWARPAPSHVETDNGAANLPDYKNLNNCSNEKLCLMTIGLSASRSTKG